MIDPKQIAAEAVKAGDGGFSDEQVEWLQAVVEKAVQAGVAANTERVIALCGQFTYARHLGEHLRNEL